MSTKRTSTTEVIQKLKAQGKLSNYYAVEEGRFCSWRRRATATGTTCTGCKGSREYLPEETLRPSPRNIATGKKMKYETNAQVTATSTSPASCRDLLAQLLSASDANSVVRAVNHLYRQGDFRDRLLAWQCGQGGRSLGGQLAKRTIQRALDRLNDLGYIKSFHVPGRRGNYEVAIDGYAIRFGPLDGQSLDAANTTDPNHPVYVKRGNFVSLRNQSSCHRER